jgi:hypothetical protein
MNSLAHADQSQPRREARFLDVEADSVVGDEQ